MYHNSQVYTNDGHSLFAYSFRERTIDLILVMMTMSLNDMEASKMQTYKTVGMTRITIDKGSQRQVQ